MPVGSKAQDLPPQGGYKPIYFKRVPTQTWLKGWQWIAGYLAISTAALSVYYITYKEITMDEIEMRSSKNVIEVVVQAERDREYLKQVRRNRDEEAQLMANVEGWKVGTWYGEPIYKTVPKDKWVDVQATEFYAHCDEKHFYDRAFFAHKT